MSDLSLQLEKASLVSEKPDEFLLVELFDRAISRPEQLSRAELSETVADFVRIFQDALFTQPAYQELMLKRAWWEKLRQPYYDTRERYISQIVDYNENLDFVGIPELKDRQSLRIEDVFISLQTQVELSDLESSQEINQALYERNIRAHLGEMKPKALRRLSANQALGESQKIVILGDPGAGKTTLLKYIVLAFAENKADKLGLQENRLPIFIRLYDYVTKREECG
jgi:predicted NACHT family NTPase